MKQTYIVRYETDLYKHTCAVNVPACGDRQIEIETAADHIRVNLPGVRRVTSVTGPVHLYEAA